ncbi:MAG: flagellar hook-length control protein FliK [Treponema porcinum]|uniref:flagellar hook-length control protein FliK n=1 Tax=Treponema porcinum TaxID=261392 RepID=UPI002A80BE22|nr:flagellar hook-length control protein FliK [Treponema porcinum]MDY5048806.1 flagellar hook-length control protein FliK [Treponema porcinum]
MQAAILNQTAALSYAAAAPKTELVSVKPGTGQADSFALKKSFDDMIKDARAHDSVQEKNAPAENTVQADSGDKPVSDTQEKVDAKSREKTAETHRTDADDGRKDVSSVKERIAESVKSTAPEEGKNRGRLENTKTPSEKTEKTVQKKLSSAGKEELADALNADCLYEAASEIISADASIQQALLAKNTVPQTSEASQPLSVPQDNAEFSLEDSEIPAVTAENPKRFSLDKDGKIKVTDYRSEEKTDFALEKADEKKSQLKITDVKYDRNSAEMTLDLAKADSVQMNILSSNSQTASANGSQFQAMLTNQIQQSAPELVKAGNIILKDNDVGQIKLVLNPESLGNVKIDLHISEKNITGRIIVASAEAYNAFKESADSLRQAFINSGFETAGFDLQFAGQNTSGQQEQHRNSDAHFRMMHTYGDYTAGQYDGDLETEENYAFSALNSVNIVA